MSSRRKANDQARALLFEADGVLAQEVALSGTLSLWLALVSHAQTAQRDTGKKPAVPSGKIRQGPKPRRTEDAEYAAASKADSRTCRFFTLRVPDTACLRGRYEDLTTET